jgi:hypothetical protein
MTESSPERSPASESLERQISMSSRDNFTHDLSSPHMSISNGASLISPNSLKTSSNHRTLSFDRERIAGSTQKVRSLTQSSGDRESAAAGLQSRKDSDEATNGLKRKITDAESDQPSRRARATIAVSNRLSGQFSILIQSSVRSLQVSKISLRWVKAQMQTLHRARRRVHLSGAWNQA